MFIAFFHFIVTIKITAIFCVAFEFIIFVIINAAKNFQYSKTTAIILKTNPLEIFIAIFLLKN